MYTYNFADRKRYYYYKITYIYSMSVYLPFRKSAHDSVQITTRAKRELISGVQDKKKKKPKQDLRFSRKTRTIPILLSRRQIYRRFYILVFSKMFNLNFFRVLNNQRVIRLRTRVMYNIATSTYANGDRLRETHDDHTPPISDRLE